MPLYITMGPKIAVKLAAALQISEEQSLDISTGTGDRDS